MIPKLLEEQAREITGKEPEWKLFAWQIVESPFGKHVRVEGAIAPLHVKGKNKGTPNWERMNLETRQQVEIAIDAHIAWVAEWEKNTGKCSNCLGKGQEWAGSNHETGHRFRICSKCSGNGCSAHTPGQLNLLEVG